MTENTALIIMKKFAFVIAFILVSFNSMSQVCTVSISHLVNGNQVQYFGSSPDNPATWSWFFNGGTPMTSSQQTQSVTYNTPGQYICALSVNGGPNNCSASLSNETDTVIILPTAVQDYSGEPFSLNVISTPSLQFEIINNKVQNITADLHDVSGKKIETVFSGRINEGRNTLYIKTNYLPSGTYLLVLKREEGVLTRRFFVQ